MKFSFVSLALFPDSTTYGFLGSAGLGLVLPVGFIATIINS
jgi:hypothetical protein